MRRALAATLVGLAATAVGCGSSSPSTTAGSTSTESTSTASTSTGASASSGNSSAPLKVATVPGLSGKVVVDSAGHTVYLLKPETSTHLLCTESACLAAWPIVTVSSASDLAQGNEGITGHLAVIKRPGGTLQVTLDGHPLYTYAGDSQSGEANGENLKSFGGTWEGVTSAGEPAASATSSGGGGY